MTDIASGLDRTKAIIDARRAHQGLPPIPVVDAEAVPPLPTADEVRGLGAAKGEDLHRFATGAVRSRDADGYAYELISPVAMLEMAAYFADNSSDYGSAANHFNASLAAAHKFLATGDVDDLRRATAHVMYAIQYEKTGEAWGGAAGADDRCRSRFDRIPPAAWAELSARYRIGASKYSSYNYERGMDVPALMNHGIKHTKDHLAGVPDRDGGYNPGGILWNYMVAIHSLYKWPRLNAGNLRRGDCVPPNVSDDEAAAWGPYFGN